MITGAHTVLYSPDADALRAFFRDVLGFPCGRRRRRLADLRPAARGARRASRRGSRGSGLYLMCDDLEATMAELAAKGVELPARSSDQGWGRVTTIALPDGGELGLYEPRHPRP